MLTGRQTRLKFDGNTSSWFEIDDGIGKGDPLSMILYLYNNTDLLDVAEGRQELVLGYVDDIALVVGTKSFKDTHSMPQGMMERPQGGYAWADPGLQWQCMHGQCLWHESISRVRSDTR